jgi:hypothetical protein
MTRTIAIAVMLLLAGCRSWLPTMRGDSGLPQFTLRVLDANYLDGGSAGFDYAVRSDGAQLAVDISVSDARGLKACYFELDYDANHWNPVSAIATQLLTRNGGELVELPVFTQRGMVTYGAVLAKYEGEVGCSGDGVVATVVFGSAPFIEPVPHTSTATFLSDMARLRSPMKYNAEDQTMNWSYVQPGDYDQNGEVNVSDLTRLALYISQTVDYGQPGTYEGVVSVADGDVNGEVNLGDISVIGANFGTRVEIFNVYAVDATEIYPSYPIFPSRLSDPFAQIGSISFSTSTGDPSQQRIGFSVPVATKHKAMWAQAATTKSLGIPTRVGWASARSAGIDIYDPKGIQLTYDQDDGELRWFYNLWWDFDQNGICAASDLSPFGAILNQLSGNDPSAYAWFLDKYRNGIVGVDDISVGHIFTGHSTTGYNVYVTNNEEEVPQDPYAPETLQEYGRVYLHEGLEAFHERTRFEFHWGVASDTYFWVRPFTSLNGTEEIGTRSGVVHVE